MRQRSTVLRHADADDSEDIRIWIFLVSGLVWATIKYTIGIRVDAEHEYEGVDLVECGLQACPEFTSAD